MDDMRDGSIDTKAGADAAELLAGALGKTTEEVLAIGDAEIDRQFKDAGTALVEALQKAAAVELASDAAYAERRRAQQQRIKDEANAAKENIKEFAELLEDAAVAAGETQVSIDKVGGVFEQMATRDDALSSIFDLKNASLDAQADVRDVALAIEGLSDVDVDLSKAARHEEVLDSIDALRPQIQERIIAAFSGGGPEAATKMAQDYIAQVAEELDITDARGGRHARSRRHHRHRRGRCRRGGSRQRPGATDPPHRDPRRRPGLDRGGATGARPPGTSRHRRRAGSSKPNWSTPASTSPLPWSCPPPRSSCTRRWSTPGCSTRNRSRHR